MTSLKGHRWTNQSLEAWIQRVANVTARLQLPEIDENNRRLQAECEYYHKKLRALPSRWIESMRRMNVDMLQDFANCVARLAEMVNPNSPTWSKANSDVEAVRFLAEYYTWEHIHLDGQSILSHPSTCVTIPDQFSYRKASKTCDLNCQRISVYPDQIFEADSVLSLREVDIVEVKWGSTAAGEKILVKDAHIS